MAYAFDLSDPSLQASIRRIIDEELGSAVTRLGRIDAPEAVHGIRKSLKKSRALLRLARAGLKDYTGLNLSLREIALALSARRDAQVRLATLQRLFPDMPKALEPLQKTLAAESDTPPTSPTPALQEKLSAIRETANTLSLSRKDDRILRQGLAITRRKARDAAEAARENPADPELIHDWRKRAKDLWYQSRLFTPVWPDLFKPIVTSADHLDEALGNHHDLSVLAAHAAALFDAVMP
ncbi:CHAD domain-containing protein, partial [Tabrizicola sp.]|uniref:CHAD domain-containing protein n=1 Tax=Tabrizicola sp. TaxID=2005166 RepID=UPI003F332408